VQQRDGVAVDASRTSHEYRETNAQALDPAFSVPGYVPTLIEPKLPRALSWWPISRALHAYLYDGRLEDYEIFRQVVESLAEPRATVLDLGAGRGANAAVNLKGRVARVIAVDVDEGVRSNPNVDQAYVFDGQHMPFLKSGSIDLVYARYVAEHLSDPLVLLTEVRRVLKPGSSLIVLTPNARHYVPQLARLLGRSSQKLVARLRGLEIQDSFEIAYKLNTPDDIARHGRAAGFSRVEVCLFENQPSYLSFHPMLFAAGALYERVVNSFDALENRRGSILAQLVA
jgi:SAM-dependent methyltransferase